MFDAVAKRYDVTNDVLSLGQDRRWRHDVIAAVDPRAGELDAVDAVAPRHGVAQPQVGEHCVRRFGRRSSGRLPPAHRQDPHRNSLPPGMNGADDLQQLCAHVCF